VELLAGRPDAAEAEALVAASDLLNDHADVLLARAEVLRLLGQDAEAAGISRRAAELYDRKGNLVSAAHARSWPDVRAPA
jgi:hypothetical protein